MKMTFRGMMVDNDRVLHDKANIELLPGQCLLVTVKTAANRAERETPTTRLPLADASGQRMPEESIKTL
jgi:hypothetical protein